MTDIEPIKASTLGQFYWCAIDAYIEHLKEIGDDRVTGGSKDTRAIREGEKHHEGSFGLSVTKKEEDEGLEIVEKMEKEMVTAVNHGDYQIQGAPDNVVIEGDTVRVEDMKTTRWDDRERYNRYQVPPARFQVEIYSWMLSQVPDIQVENPVIEVKRRVDGEAVDWFEEEIEFDKQDVEQKINQVLDLFDNPEKLKDYRPSVDWKCRNDNHWEQFQKIISDQE